MEQPMRDGAKALETAFAAMPVVAILRGVHPGEAEAIGEALVGAGVRIIEVPLNSPSPLESIARLSESLGARAIVGAGTVLRPEDAADVAAAGGQIAVSPNTEPAVIGKCLDLGLVPMPGFQTPTEAFAAIAAGASWLKLFPASALGPGFVRAIGAVLPPQARLLAVGGIGPVNLAEWRAAGVAGFGIGTDIYRPGDSAGTVAAKAAAICTAAAEAFRPQA
jgi:2-dehydro-3-deoxyphosphogalactonate aldolase